MASLKREDLNGLFALRVAAAMLAAVAAVLTVWVLTGGVAYADTEKIDSGTTGACSWEYYKDTEKGYTLSITRKGSETGSMDDYAYDSATTGSTAPWWKYSSQIERVTFQYVYQVGSYAFWKCDKIKSVEFENGVTRIGHHAFAHCTGLENITISGKDCVIENNAFDSCDGKVMNKISLKGVKSVGAQAFYEVDSESLTLGEGLETIDETAFSLNETVTEVKIPKSCKSIGYCAFHGNAKMERAVILSKDCKLDDNGNSFDNGTVTLFVKPSSKALNYANRFDFKYAVFGDMGSKIVTLSDGEKQYKFSEDISKYSSEGNTLWYTLQMLLATGKAGITIGPDGISMYLDVDLDGVNDMAVEVKEDLTFTIKALPDRSADGEFTFEFTDQEMEYFENNLIPFYNKITFDLNKKMENPIVVGVKTASVKYKSLKKKNQTLSWKKVLKIRDAEGSLSFKKISGNKKITINSKTGKVTVKKGLKKGIYSVTVKITAAGNSKYRKGSVTTAFKVKVK